MIEVWFRGRRIRYTVEGNAIKVEPAYWMGLSVESIRWPRPFSVTDPA